VAVLRLMGLFDRPADAGCLAALRSETIPGLTEPLAGLADEDWEYCLSGLETAKLLTVNRDASGALVSLDAHPLLREYFAKRLYTKNLVAWRAAHRRLYEHLCASTKEGDQPTLEDLQPLYQAVAHGCQAGLQQEACQKIYHDRILRGTGTDGFYSWKVLGAFGSNLGALVSFFEQPWSRVSTALTKVDRAWVLGETATQLRALGRLTESLAPKRADLLFQIERQHWVNAAGGAINLSEVELILGEVSEAVKSARKSRDLAAQSGDLAVRTISRVTLATALLQAGKAHGAIALFQETEAMQKIELPEHPQLFSVWGFLYFDLLLDPSVRFAWRVMLGSSPRELRSHVADIGREAEGRAAQSLDLSGVAYHPMLVSTALDQLTIGRALFYRAILEEADVRVAAIKLDTAVQSLRRAGIQDHLPRGLLTRAWLRFLTDAPTGPESAQEDLDEAWEIAERGPMKLFLADIHLHRARLFFREKSYPWKSPQDDLAAAEKLIKACGYHRRDEELADAKRAILGT
jgi:hypothetical protein